LRYIGTESTTTNRRTVTKFQKLPVVSAPEWIGAPEWFGAPEWIVQIHNSTETRLARLCVQGPWFC